jgi:hypothetical protein
MSEQETGGGMSDDVKWAVQIYVAERHDGGLRVWSDQMPGLILSGPDPAKVAADILPAINALREHIAHAAAYRKRMLESGHHD